MAAEIEFTDSQQNCECSASQMCHKPSVFANNSAGQQFCGSSFSQPISTENMLLNSQINMTQNPNSQFGSSYATASQSPMLKLVKRMTRMFVHSGTETITQELKKLFGQFMYDYKIALTNQRQRVITVTTSDKRQTLLTFKVNILEMHSQNEVLLDFRLSKGDGLEFKKIFMKIKTSLAHIVCKRYVFTNSAKGCCDIKI
jgi:serine/threonine-protein kinase Chk1